MKKVLLIGLLLSLNLYADKLPTGVKVSFSSIYVPDTNPYALSKSVSLKIGLGCCCSDTPEPRCASSKIISGEPLEVSPSSGEYNPTLPANNVAATSLQVNFGDFPSCTAREHLSLLLIKDRLLGDKILADIPVTEVSKDLVCNSEVASVKLQNMENGITGYFLVEKIY